MRGTSFSQSLNKVTEKVKPTISCCLDSTLTCAIMFVMQLYRLISHSISLTLLFHEMHGRIMGSLTVMVWWYTADAFGLFVAACACMLVHKGHAACVLQCKAVFSSQTVSAVHLSSSLHRIEITYTSYIMRFHFWFLWSCFILTLVIMFN